MSTASRRDVAKVVAAVVAAGLYTSAGRAEAETPETGLIHQAPKGLVLQATDLGVDFAIQGGDHQPGGQYVALYFRPEVLTEAQPQGGALLGVLVSVDVLETVEAALGVFERNADGGSVLEAIRQKDADASLRDVEALDIELSGADGVISFRTNYELTGVEVYEYRHRVRVANSVANVVVSGRAGPGGVEPEDLERQARAAAERQLARLVAARGS